jgi:acetate CoA/acetoacetate CoA-transferase alpha subunit
VKNKTVTLDEAMAVIHDGQTIGFSDAHGMFAADELIAGLLEKGVRDITAVSNSGGNPYEGVGLLIKNHRIKKLITTHTGMNPEAIRQINAGELEVEYCPMGTWIERQHAAAAGLGGCLTPTGVGTEVAEGKQVLNIDGRDYILEKPLGTDVALVKATKADTAGNVHFRMNALSGNDTLALASKFVIVEVEELVEFGSLGPEEIHLPAPCVDMVYLRTGEKRYWPQNWYNFKAAEERKGDR